MLKKVIFTISNGHLTYTRLFAASAAVTLFILLTAPLALAEAPQLVSFGDLTCQNAHSPFDLALERPVIAFYQPNDDEGRWVTLAWHSLMHDDQRLRFPASDIPAYMAFKGWVTDYSRVEREVIEGKATDVYILQVKQSGSNETEELSINPFNVPVYWQLHTFSQESQSYQKPYIGHKVIVDLREHFFEHTLFCF